MKITMDVKGIGEVRKRIMRLGDLSKDAAVITAQRSCNLIAESARKNLQYGRPEWPPFKEEHKKQGLYRTGQLIGSIRTTYLSRGNDIVGLVYSDAPHAPYHELGTGGIHADPARPFLWPAVTDNIENIRQIAKEAVETCMLQKLRTIGG